MDLLLPELGLFFWTLLAFLAVFFILKKFAWKPILSALETREKGIADSIASAEKMKGEMANMQADNEKLMVAAREERSAMLKEAKELKDKLINDAKEQAKTEANKIVSEAQLQIQQQKNAALADAKNQIGQLAVEISEKILRKQLDNPEAQVSFAQSLANDVKLN